MIDNMLINIPALLFGLILIALCILAISLAWKATRNRGSKFDFAQAFLSDDGKTSMARIGQFVALSVSTWAFVYMTSQGKLTEWFFNGYMLVWAATGISNKFIDRKWGGQDASPNVAP